MFSRVLIKSAFEMVAWVHLCLYFGGASGQLAADKLPDFS
jgi:hypothetical protein